MNNKALVNILENVSIILGVTISVETIESILGIVILVFQIIWIVVKSGIAIYRKIKDKKYDEIDDEVKTGIDELKNIQDDTHGEQHE